jgi:tRNA 2-thiouridine synthesizing protein E
VEVIKMAGVDINKYIADREAMGRDPEGYMMDLEPWSEAQAKGCAEEEGIELEGGHWEVIHFLRERFLHEGQAKSGRHVLDALDQAFADRGGKRYLYTLFPGGPVTQGSRLAGLPLPPYTTDPSFGSHE